MTMPKQPRIFLSYASPDLETAWKVYNYLTENGYSLWFDKKDLRQGHDWAEGITRGIHATTMILVLISQHSNDNPNVRSEVNLASQRRLEMKGVLLEDVVLSPHLNYHLSAVQFVKASGVAEQDWLRNLNSALRAFHPSGYQEPDEQAPLPTVFNPLPLDSLLFNGQYRVVDKIGQGNFGQTYLCEDRRSFNRKVVIKEHILEGVRHPNETKLYPKKGKESTYATALAKFVQEAQRLTQLNTHIHPSIPEFLAFFQENGTAYYVMKYYKGETLEERMKRGGHLHPLPLAEALSLLTPTLDALAFLHHQHFYHRDLKPDNLFRTVETAGVQGYTLLLDFGLTREIVSSEDLPTSIGHTGFAPPEQLIAGKPQGAWTDIYALTGTLYYLITGQIPNRTFATWRATSLRLPPLVTNRLETFLAKGLAGRVEMRYQSIDDLRADWDALCQSFTDANEAERKAKEAEYLAAKRKEAELAKAELAKLKAATARMDAELRVKTEEFNKEQAQAELAQRQQEAAGRKEPVKPAPITPSTTAPPIKPTPNQLPKPTTWKRWAGIALFAGAGLWGLNTFTPEGETPVTPNAKTQTVTPSTTSLPRLWTNSIGMKFVRIEKGSFMMGSTDSDQEASSDEKPQHRVNITKDFYMGQYEVTQDEFGAFVGATGYVTEAEKDGGCYVWNGSSWNKDANKNWRTVFVGGTRPVVCVSHNDALAYVAWLNQKEGTNTYRLPTEAEWEYAARAGSRSKYSFGDDAAQLCQYGNLADASTDFSWKASCNDGVGKETSVVGRYRPNTWGLYDVHGNVWEWVQDWYNPDYYKNSPSSDPSNLTKNSSTNRVLRGGSWSNLPQDLRSAYRSYINPSYRGSSVGFRLSKTLD